MTILEFDSLLCADTVLQGNLFGFPNVTTVNTAQTIVELGDGSKVNGLRYTDLVSGEVINLELDGIFV